MKVASVPPSHCLRLIIFNLVFFQLESCQSEKPESLHGKLRTLKTWHPICRKMFKQEAKFARHLDSEYCGYPNNYLGDAECMTKQTKTLFILKCILLCIVVGILICNYKCSKQHLHLGAGYTKAE